MSIVLDGTNGIITANINTTNLNSTTATIGNVSNTELQYLDSVTSSIQTQINNKSPINSPSFTGIISYPTNLNNGGFNIVFNQTYSDTNIQTITYVQNTAGIIYISTDAETTAIPFFPNGGSGIAYTWTILDPDAGWNYNWNGTMSFEQSGSGVDTFSVTFQGGDGLLKIQRTGGSGTYAVRLTFLGGTGFV